MTQVAAQHESAREHLLRRLQDSRERYLGVVANIPEDAAAFRKAEGTWSILECAEHVAVAERQMLAMWVKLAQAGEADHGRDAAIAAGIVNRAKKQVSPERARPGGRYPMLADAVREFAANRERSIAYLESHAEELRTKIIVHPLFGTIDGYQLFLVMAGHPERHAAQIEELKQSLQEKH